MMKTSDVCLRYDSKLVRAIVRAVGRDAMRDIAIHGADSGWSGFTYYRDTVAFFKKYRRAIVAMATQMADDMGDSPIDMVAGFNCLGGRHPDRTAAIREYTPSVSRCLYGGRITDEDTEVANALAWFALEEVALAFVND